MRFWPKVKKSDGCWEWQASRDHRGYGKASRSGGDGWMPAHRAAWELTYGPIPDDLCVLHRCDNPPCVRPDHLFLGTRGDNNRDASRKGRSSFGDRNGSRIYIERMPRGSDNARAKLTEADVRAMRDRAAAGERQSILADEFHISRANVCLIVNRKVWKHLD